MQILSSRAPVKVLIKVDLTKVSSPCAGLEISEFGISLKGAKFEISKLLNGSKFMFNIHKYNYRQNRLHCIYWIFQLYVSESAIYVAGYCWRWIYCYRKLVSFHSYSVGYSWIVKCLIGTIPNGRNKRTPLHKNIIHINHRNHHHHCYHASVESDFVVLSQAPEGNPARLRQI